MFNHNRYAFKVTPYHTIQYIVHQENLNADEVDAVEYNNFKLIFFCILSMERRIIAVLKVSTMYALFFSGKFENLYLP